VRGWAIRWFAAQDWRYERIAELEAALAASAADLAVERARVAQLEQRVATFGARVAELLGKLRQKSQRLASDAFGGPTCYTRAASVQDQVHLGAIGAHAR
jgi:hypothetical protein